MEPLSDGSPYETYERGQSQNIWVNASDGVTPLVGQVRISPWVRLGTYGADWGETRGRFFNLLGYFGKSCRSVLKKS